MTTFLDFEWLVRPGESQCLSNAGGAMLFHEGDEIE